MEKTTVINLIGGPGSGKSTGAAYVFSQLKMHGINCEYVPEWAKEAVWERRGKPFENQLYVLGKQSYRMSRLRGEVDVIITDSPILMGAYYCQSLPYAEDFTKVLLGVHEEYDNINIFIERVKPYNPKGRFQNEEGAKKIDEEIQKLYARFNKGMNVVKGEKAGYDMIVEAYFRRLEDGKTS